MNLKYYIAKTCKRLKLDKLYGKRIKQHRKANTDVPNFYKVLNERYNQERQAYASIANRENWNQIKEFDLQIIVSVFNGEQYISACIDSILNQKTNYNWQLIVVNDGSTDGTRDILEQYNDYRLKLINQNNKGFSGGRNRGLDEVSSSYVMFVDVDDLLEDNAIEKLLSFAYKHNLDIVEGNFYSLNRDKKKKKSFYSDKIISNPIISLRGYPWGKVIRTNMFERIQFPCGYWFEDSIFTFLLYPLCSKCGTISDYVYSYRKNTQGISNKSKQQIKCLDTVYVIEEMLKSAHELGIRFSFDYHDAFLKHACLSCERLYFMDKEVKLVAFHLLCELYAKFFSGYNTQSPILKKVSMALSNRDYKVWSKIALYCNY